MNEIVGADAGPRVSKLRHRVAQVARVVLHPVEFARFMLSMARHRRAGRIRSLAPKYLGDYVSASLGPAERSALIRSHHAIVERRLRVPGLDRGLALWTLEDPDEGTCYALVLRPAYWAPMEGECELTLMRDGVSLTTLTFLVADRLPQDDTTGIMLVGCIQGVFGTNEIVRRFARLNGEIAPAHLLLMAAKSLCDVLGLAAIYGIGSEARPPSEASHRVLFDYEAFWTEAGARRTERGYHRLDRGPETDPDAPVQSANASRTRRKRRRKIMIRQEITAHLDALRADRRPS